MTAQTQPAAAGSSFYAGMKVLPKAEREAMYAVAERLDPEQYRALARAVYAELALAGVTCVGEFHYLHHAPGGTRYADPNVMGEALADAAKQAGIRLTLLDTCYLAGGIGEPLAGTQVRFGDGDAERWADRAGELAGRLPTRGARLGAALHSVRAVPRDQMATVVAWAGERAAIRPGRTARVRKAPAMPPPIAAALGFRLTPAPIFLTNACDPMPLPRFIGRESEIYLNSNHFPAVFTTKRKKCTADSRNFASLNHD